MHTCSYHFYIVLTINFEISQVSTSQLTKHNMTLLFYVITTAYTLRIKQRALSDRHRNIIIFSH